MPRSTFTYDATGGIATATNADAEITRTYYRNGALKSDVSQLAVVDLFETPVADRFAQHSYGLNYQYDLSGRRISRTGQLPGCVTPCEQTYGYMPYTGMLISTTDGGSAFSFEYDAAGRLTKRKANTTSVIETMHYDVDGQLDARTVAASGSLPVVYGDVLTYDKAGRVTQAGTSSDRPLGETTMQAYTGLGSLAVMQHAPNGNQLLDEFSTDAFGNTMVRRRQYADGARDTVTSVFDGERLTSLGESGGGGRGGTPPHR